MEKGGILSGVVSRKDLLKASIGAGDLQKMPVKMLMTPVHKLVVTTKEESVLVAAKKLIDHAIDSLPVVQQLMQDGKAVTEIVGRLTKTNVTRLFVEIGEEKRR